MKKWCLFLSVYLCLCVLAACGAAGSGAPVPGGTPSGEAQAGGETAQPASVTVTCRVVAAEDGQLLLAGQGDDTNIYTLFREEDDLHPGEVVKVCYSGGLLETWPVQFGGVASAEVCPGGFDDLCVLYLRVLEDLWTVLEPCWCRVKGLFVPRGGTRIHVFAEQFKDMPEEKDAAVRAAVQAWRTESDPHRP